MEKVLRSKEMDKIDELFNEAFNLSSNIVFFPIRHHSPTCSYHLIKTIENYNPDIILIEGPIDGNAVVEFMCHEDTKAPIALYYSYSDTKGYVNKEKEKYKCYYPFLDYSPEFIALREGKKRGIESKFIDLSYGEILINSSNGKGLLRKSDKLNYNDDYLLGRGRYLELICEKEGCRNFNEVWEKLFEVEGLYLSTDEFVKNILSYCYLSRMYSLEQELIEEGCIAREIFMASQIKKEISSHNKILVVTGGFHTYGILERLNKEDKTNFYNIGDNESNVYAMAYSMEGTDQLNGYSSGMPYPEFYQSVWNRIYNKEERPYEASVLNHIIKCGKGVRKHGGCISTFDEICALNMAQGLSNIRDKKESGVYELIDCITSSFVKGDLNVSTEDPLNILFEDIRGKKIGELCENADVPPIIQDFKNVADKFRLKIKSTIESEVILEIFSSKRHREISKVLYIMEYLETGFCKMVKGPNILLKKNVNLIRETWKYKWSTKVNSELLDKSVYGGTLREAAISLVKNDIKKCAKSAGDISKILVQSFNMGLEEIFNSMIKILREVIAKDSNFNSLIKCMNYLNYLFGIKDLYYMNSIGDIKEIIFSCYSKLVIIIPGLNSVPEEEEGSIVEGLKEIYNTVLNREMGLNDDLLNEALNEILQSKEVNPAIEGACLGILFGLNQIKIDIVAKAVEGYILGTHNKLLSSPAFLNGLFKTAKDVVFVENSILKSIDRFVNEVSDDDFMKVIPEFRLAFSYFTPKEIDEIGMSISKIYGVSKKKFDSLRIIAPETLSLGVQIDKHAKEILEGMEVL